MDQHTKIDKLVPGYEILERIYQSGVHVLYRARRIENKEEVIIKTCADKYPKKEDLLEIQREYRIGSQLKIEGVIKYYDLVPYGLGNLAVIMERFGISLHDYVSKFENQIIPLNKFYPLAIRLVQICGNIHVKKIVHKQIEPSNILIDPVSEEVVIVDFGAASELSREYLENVSFSKLLKGNLPYLSPEQTGRINREIDYRSDFYSLGMTFYEILNGQLPFQANDPLEWVHSIISRDPMPLHESNPRVPHKLSEIITKLISKNAENRYQSAYGLIKDLEKCRESLDKGHHDFSFDIAEFDVSRKFKIPQKLYGREEEVEKLESYFSRSSDGSIEFCLVSGYSGVGKTALVKELRRSIVKKNGHFIRGKFEQFRQNAPYVAVGNAFSDLMRQLLGESENRLKSWQKKIKQSLGSNAQLMVDLIPELQIVIGEQEVVPELSLEESQNRFLMLFVNFVKVFAAEDHPLVIFLDDLQWSDVPTLKLINRLVTANDLGYLFVIGAYRDNEIDTTHPLNLTLREIQSNRFVENLSLSPLDLEATTQLTRDTLLADPTRSKELSRVFYEKTGGNPFFTIELLKNLKYKEVIYFNVEKACWDWDIKAIKDEDYSDNVIDILVNSQSRLSPSSQRSLQLAACIGTTFDLNTLSIIEGRSTDKTGARLYDALRFNMIVPLDESYKYIGAQESDLEQLESGIVSELNPVYKFQHDRVQQAAYSQIPIEERKELHLSIGRLILKHSSKEVQEERLMDIVGHLNQGRHLITAKQERGVLARLNLSAGIKAMQSSAYESAVGYLRIGNEILGEDAWKEDYQLAWELNNELQQAFYLAGDWKNADTWSSILLEYSKTPIEKGLILASRTRQYSTTQRMKESIQAAHEGLFILGFEFASDPGTSDVEQEVKRVYENLQGRPISSLINLPEMTDQKARIANQLLMEIFPAAFLSGSGQMFPYLVLKSVNIALKYGNSIESAFAYVAYAMLLCGFFNDPAQGYEYGRLGVNLSEKLGDISLKARIIYVYTMFVHHWSNHWSSMTPWFRNGIETGYQSGDLLYLAYSAQDCIIWDPKLDLETASEEHRRLLEIVEECEYQDSLDSGTLFLQMQLNFQGLTKSKYSLTNDDFDENQCIEGMYERHFMTGISNYHIYKAEIHLMYNDAVGAFEHILEQEKLMASVIALPQVVRFHIVSFLVRSMLLPTLKPEDQELYLGVMHDSLKKVSGWASHCRENFEHLRLHMEAFLESFKGNVNTALSLYEQAIKTAKEYGFLRDEAMANEMAGRLLLGLGLPKAADGYLQEAQYLYYRWGAHRKVEDMEQNYQVFDGSVSYGKEQSYGSGSKKPGAKGKEVVHTDLLDISSVLKASQLISGELVLEKLLKATLSVLIENAGAQKGFLVEQREKRIIIRAYFEPHKDTEHREQVSEGSEQEHQLPLSLINTAIRTNKPVVIDNTDELNPFSSDPYLKKSESRSMMCVPLPLHGKWPIAVYLENNITYGAFTEERVQVIKLLASQASVSMENARIYERQEKLLKAQQRFVPSQFLKHLGHDDITKVELGESVAMEMSVLFSDILDFTPLVEKQSPEVVIQFLNRLFNQLGASIRTAEGFIDSYAGDGIMALFAVPPSQAIEAGILMGKALEDFNQESINNGLPAIKLGIGINTGPLVLGTMGANERMQCSVLGDTVNLASRIEQLTRVYDAQCLIGENTFLSLHNKESLSIRMVDYVRVKGKGIAVRLYEVLDAENPDRRKSKEATKAYIQKGMEAYYSRNFTVACELFKQALQLDPIDPVPSLFVSRSENYLKNPPSEDWQGHESLQKK